MINEGQNQGDKMTTRYAWKDNYIDLNEKGNTYFGDEASKIMFITYKIFSEHKKEKNLTNWEHMMTQFIVPALLKKTGVTVLKGGL